jgi:hypothetical protein
MADADLRARLLTSLSTIRAPLDALIRKGPRQETLLYLVLLEIEERELRAAFECLWALGLSQDATRLGTDWKTLNAFAIGPAFNQCLTWMESNRHDQRQWLVEHFGWYPTPAEAAESAKALTFRRAEVFQTATVLAQHIERLQTTFAPTEARPSAPEQKPVPTSSEEPPSPGEQIGSVSRAIGIMVDYARNGMRLKVDDLARMVGCARSTLYDDSYFRAARAALKAVNRGTLPKGSKDADGNVDAVDPGDD